MRRFDYGRKGCNDRGGSKIHFITLGSGDNATRYVFSKHGATNYYSRDGSDPMPTPDNMTEKEFLRRAKSNGAIITSKKIKRKSKNQIEKEKKARNDFLDRAYVSDRTMVKGSRAAAKRNRAVKRNIM